MLDSVFIVPPLFDDSYYGQVIHEIREMTVMNMGNYAHGNQPIQHMIYLYNYAWEPWKAQIGFVKERTACILPVPTVIAVTRTTGSYISAWMSSLCTWFLIRFALVRTSMYWAPLCSVKIHFLHFENGKSLTNSMLRITDRRTCISSLSR